jgi:ATP-dependent exoDNAse (exonuclease V) alpha subunit
LGFPKPPKVNERRWSKHYELLFIDEVSMVSGEMLDALDDILRQVRHNEREAFGGIQLVFVGDLAQLSPIQEKLQRYNEQHFLPKEEWDFHRHEEFWNMPVVFNETGMRQDILFSNRCVGLGTNECVVSWLDAWI